MTTESIPPKGENVKPQADEAALDRYAYANDEINRWCDRIRRMRDQKPTGARLAQEFRLLIEDDQDGIITRVWYDDRKAQISFAGKVLSAIGYVASEDVAHQVIRGVFPDFHGLANGHAKPTKKKGDDGPEWQVDQQNRIRPNENNFLLAMAAAGIGFRYDEFSDDVLIDGLEGHGPRLSDVALSELYLLIQRRFSFKIAREDLRDMVRVECHRNRFHPIRDYLDGLEWDGIERINEWLPSYGGSVSTPFVRAVSAISLIAAVRRMRKPGCKFDEMLILESPEGYEKSTAFEVLAGKEYFSDQAPFGANAREVIESLRGSWIIECADLDTMSRPDVASMKAFLSRSYDRSAMKYEKLKTVLPRHCVFVGTTNEDAYLLSKTGNRRFWPVQVQRFDIESLTRDRDQLWAEAAYREAQGESIRLPQHLWEDAKQQQKEREIADEWEGIVDGWLEDQERQPHFQGFRTRVTDVARDALRLTMDKVDDRTAKRIAHCLKKAGYWMYLRSNGNRWWQKMK